VTPSDSAIAIRDQPRRSNSMIVMRASRLSFGAMHDPPLAEGSLRAHQVVRLGVALARVWQVALHSWRRPRMTPQDAMQGRPPPTQMTAWWRPQGGRR
jgi:hypothetical protein